MAKKIDKSKTIIKDDGVRIIFKNDMCIRSSTQKVCLPL